ncbi:PX domain-containing protein EREL1 isoform X2 [Lactuca sativa]|uniref:PX domain-containing protein EREL1 isoform X2 n=1 Tax=Lactuca sativa TaxID=4236 RepID=UPI000CD880D2|nr:PX domain-containing protein EREL1 isoform X2 [Lactuca sativa]
MQEGRNSVWPHDLHKGWSYCVTIPSLISGIPTAGSSDAVFYGVKVGIQSPEGITTTRTVPRRFNEFLNLYSELRKGYPKKNLPRPPPKRFVKAKSKKVLVDRICALECWMTKLLSDIDVSRSAPVAIFLELEAAAREACNELNQNDPADMDNSSSYETSDLTSSTLEKENSDELNSIKKHFTDASNVNTNHDDDDERDSNSGLKSEQNGVNIEDLIRRLNEETVARQYFTTKVKDLEMELETRIQSNKNMEELRRKCMELDLRLTIEQEARAYAESMKETMIQKNEMLMKEIEILRKEKEEMELKVKSFSKISEDKLMVDTCVSLSDTIDVLETSDTQIGLILAGEAGVVGEDGDNDNEDDDDDELRKLLGDILIENAKLREQVNSVISHALSKPVK